MCGSEERREEKGEREIVEHTHLPTYISLPVCLPLPRYVVDTMQRVMCSSSVSSNGIFSHSLLLSVSHEDNGLRNCDVDTTKPATMPYTALTSLSNEPHTITLSAENRSGESAI